MKKRKLTKEELKKLEKNLSEYFLTDTVFTVNCHGGELLAIIMALKMFINLDECTRFVVDSFKVLIESYKRKVIEDYRGVQLIDFDDPAKYFASLASAESDVKMEMALTKLDNAFDLIHQYFDEDDQ